MAKKKLRGFSALRFWPVTTNSSTAYEVGSKFDVPAVVSATVTRNVEDYTDYADDGVYDSGSDFKDETMEIVLQELPLDLASKLDGASYDSSSKIYTWATDDIAPELAMGFRALMRDGNYLMVQYYSVVVTNIKVDYQTRGAGSEGSQYTITVRAATRNADNAVHRKKESTQASDLTWLDTVDAIPAA